jgi:predicted  nucleic acid-binding Zn-ribbon protein
MNIEMREAIEADLESIPGLKTEIGDLRHDLAESNATIESLEDDLDEAKITIDALNADLTVAENEIGQAERTIYHLRERTDGLDDAFDELEMALPIGTRVLVFGRPGLIRYAIEEIRRLNQQLEWGKGTLKELMKPASASARTTAPETETPPRDPDG